jgi:hypothetical protein
VDDVESPHEQSVPIRVDDDESPHEQSASVLVDDDGIDSDSSGEWHLPGIAELNELEDQRAVERTRLATMRKGIKRKAEEDGHDLQERC